jgi:hypothetical protein
MTTAEPGTPGSSRPPSGWCAPTPWSGPSTGSGGSPPPSPTEPASGGPSEAAVQSLFRELVPGYQALADQRAVLKGTTLSEEEFSDLVLAAYRACPAAEAPRTPRARESRASWAGWRKPAAGGRSEVRRLWEEGAGHRGDHSAWEAYNGLVQWLDHSPLLDSGEDRLSGLLHGRLSQTKQRVYARLLAHAMERSGGMRSGRDGVGGVPPSGTVPTPHPFPPEPSREPGRKAMIHKALVPLRSLAEWKEHASPKSAVQWKEGRSAVETARAGSPCRASQPPSGGGGAPGLQPGLRARWRHGRRSPRPWSPSTASPGRPTWTSSSGRGTARGSSWWRWRGRPMSPSDTPWATESPRVCRRPQSLRGWGHEQGKEVLFGAEGAGGPDGLRA